MSPINYHFTLQVHTGAHAAGEDLLGQGELLGGGKSVQEVGGVLQRARHVEAERGARAVHAGQQVQGGHRVLRADKKKHYDSILDVEAVVLANLCVSYIMTRFVCFVVKLC